MNDEIEIDDGGIEEDRADPRIDVREAHELRYWTGMLNCSEAELRAAIAAVGASPKSVHEYVRGAGAR